MTNVTALLRTLTQQSTPYEIMASRQVGEEVTYTNFLQEYNLITGEVLNVYDIHNEIFQAFRYFETIEYEKKEELDDYSIEHSVCVTSYRFYEMCKPPLESRDTLEDDFNSLMAVLKDKQNIKPTYQFYPNENNNDVALNHLSTKPFFRFVLGYLIVNGNIKEENDNGSISFTLTPRSLPKFNVFVKRWGISI